MEEKLKEFYRLKYLDFTCYDVIAPHGVLDIFQDIAGKHSESYGMSYGEMMASNKIWVLLRVKYRVLKNIPLYANVNAITWPKKKGLVDFDRETQICDMDGNLLVAGISKWVILDANTRKIVPAKHIDYNAETSDETNFNDKFEKIKEFRQKKGANYGKSSSYGSSVDSAQNRLYQKDRYRNQGFSSDYQ